MTALLVILDAALTLLAGAALTGLIRTHLTIAERALIGLVSGLLVTSAATYGLSLLAGLTTATVIGGPLVVLGAALAGSLLTVDPRAAWYASWVESRDGWSQHVPWFSIAALAAGVAVVTAIFAHTVGYPASRPPGSE